MSPILTPGMGGHGMDAAPQAIHYTIPKEKMPRPEEPFNPFGRVVKPNRKGRNPRNMAIFAPSPTNVEKVETVQGLPQREKVSRKLSFEKPTLPDIPGRITERIGRKARETSRFPGKPEESLQETRPPKRHSKQTRAHTKNLLERDIVRLLDKRYIEEEGQEYPTPEELERVVAKKTRAVLRQTMPANNPVYVASKKLSGRSYGDRVTHGTITKKMFSAAFRRADEEKSREKEKRNEARKLKEEASATQFLETEEDLYAEAALLAEEELLRGEERKSAELLALYQEAHDPKSQQAQRDDLLEKYPEVLDHGEYIRRMRVKESRESVLSVLARHAEDAKPVEKITRVRTGNGDLDDMAASNGKPDRNLRRAIIRQKTEEGVLPETFFPNPRTQAFPDHMTQQ